MNKEFQKRVLSSLVLIPLIFFFVIEGSFLFNFFLIICLIITSYEWYMMSKKKFYNIFGHLFIFISFYSAYALRNNFDGDSLIIFLFILITCISTDLGGYIFGKILKGPKLTKVSPKKTYSGVIGGYFLSLLINVFFNYSFFYYENIFNFSMEFFFIILLISTISQTGDIVISYFKRLSKIKDTGKIIPGHGGLLDRIDGMIFAFPFSYLLFNSII